MFKARICGWIGLLPLFMLSLPVQAELRCVANAVDIEQFFSAATAEDKQQVEQAINSSVNLVPFGLSASDWKVHRGDLVVEGNIESNQKLIVLGNLTVKGNISTFSLSNPWVILGNVTATNIVTDSPLLIAGSINASGLVFIDSYYDNPSTIKGSINARGIFINDIIAPVVASSTNSEFMVRASDKNDTENVKKALMIINPDAYYWGLINDEDALKEIFKRSNIRMAGNVCNQMKKEALFRPKPSPELVQELQMLDEGNVAAFEGRDIATFDLAIIRTLPRLKGISANLRKQLINSNDEQTIGPAEGSIEASLTVLAEMQQQGLVKHIGLSNVTPTQVAEARKIAEIVCVQNEYNIAHRADDAMIDALAHDGIAYVPFFPLGGFTPLQSSTLSDVAASLGATPMQVALAWLLQRSPNILLIPGTSSVAHLRENMAAEKLQLSEEVLSTLDGISRE